ncbi:MAG: OB-fold domain-containing protein [Acidimicrobiales bacterium]
MGKTQVPAVEGLFTMGDEPRLIGGKGKSRDSYFFPKNMGGSDPSCLGDDEREEVLLSRTGTIWSYTTSSYPPPLPYIVTTEPFEPIVIGAVELDDEKMVVLGQMATGVAIDDMSIGMRVQLILDVLNEDDEHQFMVWKWEPLNG